MSKLAKMSAAMYGVARRTGKSQKTLSRGLTLTLRYISPSGAWKLSLTRRDTYPGEKEEEIIRAAFNVPAGAYREQLPRPPWHIIRYSWRESVLVQTELIPGIQPLSHYYDQ